MAEMSVREKITYAALDLFSQKGFDATTVEEIADAAGMKGPNLYKYFKGKEDILKNIRTIADEPYKGMLGYDDTMPIWIHNGDELKEFTWYHVNYTMNNETIVKLRKLCTIEQFRNNELTREMTDHQYELILNLYEKVFTDMIKRGTIVEGNPKILSLQYTAPIALLIQLSDREPTRRQESIDMMNGHMDSFIEMYLKK
ncbi:MAG: TetR/AcrR family transcriptional regulator [Eubacterium sp.]|nr:TetR/AcrR family transcriptional regulator [Eubacterium sp.]